MASPSRWRQLGVARIRATAENGITRMTQVSHRAPMRLVPILSSSIQRAGAAVAAVSSYGGGMLAGDSHELQITVEPSARLGLITQGPSRIYKRTKKCMTCRSTIEASVASDGFLVLAVDPCIPFSTASFQQTVNVTIEPGASAILVDWFGAGRLSRGERWDFDYLHSQTALSRTGAEPFLVESTLLNPTNYCSRDPFGFREFNAFCSVILHGPQAGPVTHQLKHLSQQLASAYTRIRTNSTDEAPESSLSLSGRVLLGVSEVKGGSTNELTHVVRLAATCNEDIYRILHSSLRPLGFGIEFYKDRIHSTRSQIRPLIKKVDDKEDMETPKSQDKHQPFQGLSWNAYMLADSGLPTGGFAHSSGIEAASQLGLVETETALQDYIHVSLRSVMQQQAPFVMRSLTRTENWQRMDMQLHATMVANAVACRASQEQGEGLLRVAISWLRHRNNLRTVHLLQEIQESIVGGGSNGHAHLAIVFGLVASSLALNEAEAAQIFGYCAARDMVSAAIRLNLIGPLAGVTLLDSCWEVIQEGVASAIENEKEGGPISSTCSPIAEAVSPCHDLLSTRLFRT